MPEQPTILVIDDNDFIRLQIVKFLQSGGWDTVEATGSAQAMEVLHEKADSIGCMLVDVRMEPEDGFDFLQKVRAANLTIPSILVTGDENTDILSKASSMGVVSVLMKPVNRDRLLKMVQRAITISGRS